MLYHVTGANGRVGVEISEALAKQGDVHATDVDNMDVTDLAGVTAALAARPPDVVVHLAGLKGNLPSRENPLRFFGVNTMGTLNLLEASRLAGAKHFIFFSSLTAHGPDENAVDETSPLNPLHPYSGSKASAEFMVQAYANAYGMRATIFRPNFIVARIDAPAPYEDNLIYDFIGLVKDGGNIELAGHGQYEREWMHPKDVANAVSLAIKSDYKDCETYILRGERVTMQELADRIIKRVGKGTTSTNPDRGGFSIISSGEKARRQLGFETSVSLDTLIDDIWDEYQNRHR